jgi:hypothetical protein
MSVRSSWYQRQITGAPGGVAYELNGVRFDGWNGRVLLEAKGLGYADFVRNGEFREDFYVGPGLVSQARRQLWAAGGRPIQWWWAEQSARDAGVRLLEARGVRGIEHLVRPPYWLEQN